MASEIGKRDENFVPVLMLEKDDGSGEVMMARADTSGRLKVTLTGGGTGDVSGPGASTDNAVVRWDSTAGTDVQNSVVIIGDTGAVTGISTAVASTSITIGAAGTATGNLLINGTTSGTITIKSADAAGTYSLTLPTTDGGASEFLQTDGSGVLSWAVPTASAAGLDTQVQFNDGGSALGGDAGFVYNKTTNTATLGILQVTNDGLKVGDTNDSHYLFITPGSDLSADRIFTVTTGDAARTLSMAGNITTAADFITVGANSLTLTTGGATDVTLPTTGTLATLAGSEELDNKTLDSSVAKGTWTASGTWTIPAVTLGGTLAWGSQAASGTLSNGGTITTIDINGGTLDGTVIGGASAAAGTFTTISGTTITGSTAGNVLTATNSSDAASVQVGILQGDRATMADNDEAYITLKLSDSAGNQDEQARITWKATTVASGATQDGDLILSAMVNGVLTTMLTLDGSASVLVPGVGITATGITSADLGTVTTIDINGGTVDGVTIGGASAGAITGTTITVNTSLLPDANDGAVLGGGATAFSDLFLASGALIGFANGNAVITHSSGVIKATTGEFQVTSANVGTNADSVPTLSSTSTFTNKTLTSPVLTTPSLSGTFTLGENQILLDPALSADGTFSGVTEGGTAGAALAFGDLCYLAAADSRWELADASAASTAGDVKIGICVLAAGADGNATTMLLFGKIRADTAFPAMTISAPLYISETAGDITGTQPTTTDAVIRRVGFANTADELFFCPSPDYITHT